MALSTPVSKWEDTIRVDLLIRSSLSQVALGYGNKYESCHSDECQNPSLKIFLIVTNQQFFNIPFLFPS